MVSRRNFFSIFLMMAVLLFMFQFSQVVRESQSNYDVNTYVSDQPLSGQQRWRQKFSKEYQIGSYRSGDYALFFGEDGSNLEQVVEQWCSYTKRNLIVCASLDEYTISRLNLPEVVLIDSRVIDLEDGLPSFNKYTSLGVPIIFCNMPDPLVIRRNAFVKNMFGIREVIQNEVEVEGVHLFGDFLLGGESFYKAESEEDEDMQDLDLTMPWYFTSSGTKTYMVGMLDEMMSGNEARNEYFPSLIWRNGYNNSHVFMINGDYLESMLGVGILDGIMYEADSYALYPVVNAQNVAVVNFPGFAGENDAEMVRLYSRNTEGAMRDIFWPAISGMAENSHYRLTSLMTAQYNYSDDVEPSGNMLAFYLQQFREFGSEAGLSLDDWDEMELGQKLQRDEQFYSSLKETYTYGAAYANPEELGGLEAFLNGEGLLRNVETVTSDYQDMQPIVSYYNDDVTLQSTTADARFHTYSDNLRVRSIETALGYSNVMLDMYPVIWPESKEDQWEIVAEEVISNMNTYWKPFAAFDKTTLSESDTRIRNFLNLDYSDRRTGNLIDLTVTGVDEGWFLLRLHGESISQIEGGDYREIETGAYLIHATQGHVTIQVEKSRGLLQYSNGVEETAE